MAKFKRKYTLGEEIFNSVSHGIGAGLSIAGTVVLIVTAAIHTNAWGVVSSCIYGASLIILYTMSTLYHSFTNEKVKAFFRIMDHNTIFLLIAGTYTPITLYYLNGVTGWILFGIVWASAIFGIVMNSINLEKARIPSIFCYIGMGWVIIFAIKPLMEHMPSISGIFLIIGGVFYTVGIIFYAIKKVKYFHSIWHLFTVAGSVFHYFAILLGFFCSPKFYKKICLVYGNTYGNLSYRQSFLWKCVLLLVSLVICVVLNIIGIFEFVKIFVCIVAVAIDFNNTDCNV